MLRILWVVVLFVAVGAHGHDPVKDVNLRYTNIRFLLEELSSDLNTALRKTLNVPLEASLDNSYTATSTAEPTSGYTPTASTTTPYPVSRSTVCATKDCKRHEVPSESSTQEYPPRPSSEYPTQGQPIRVGSIKGIPGVNFPDYAEIPLTSFVCFDKKYIPGFYADIETRCQVFHVCLPHRRESFLCPVGTIFNQALLVCDYWYSSNCSLAPHYYNVNAQSVQPDKSLPKKDSNTGSMIDVLVNTGEIEKPSEPPKDSPKLDSSNQDFILSVISKFLPVKAKVTVYPETTNTRSKVIATASVGSSESVGTSEQWEDYRRKHHHDKTSQAPTAKPHRTSEATTASSTAKPIHTSEATTASSTAKPIHTSEATTASSTAKPIHTSEATTISAPQLSTQPPKPTRNLNFDETVRLIMIEVFDALKTLAREVKEVLEIADRQTPKPVPTTRYPPVTHVNPSFTTKPILTKGKSGKSRSSSSTKTKQRFGKTNHPVPNIPKRPVDQLFRHTKSSISPLTKKALIANYIRLLKTKA